LTKKNPGVRPTRRGSSKAGGTEEEQVPDV